MAGRTPDEIVGRTAAEVVVGVTTGQLLTEVPVTMDVTTATTVVRLLTTVERELRVSANNATNELTLRCQFGRSRCW